MLTVHHLQRSQSERVVWLCEELGIPYELHVHPRNPHTGLAPLIFKQLHSAGTAPVITDGPSVIIAESGACIEYICRVHGGDRLLVQPGAPHYPEFLQMFHWTNATLQAATSRVMWLNFAFGPEAVAENTLAQMVKGRVEGMLTFLDERLNKTQFLVGDELTAADIMVVYTLTTSRGFSTMDFTGRENILAYLQRLGKRPAYIKAREKGDPETPPLLGAVVERFHFPGLGSKK